MIEAFTVELPWPSKTLSPNARAHWRRVNAMKQLAKRDAFYATRSVRREKVVADRVTVRVMFSPPDRRHRDTDNMVASMKAAFDGIAQCVGVDDSQWDLHIERVGDPVKNGRVRVELEWRT